MVYLKNEKQSIAERLILHSMNMNIEHVYNHIKNKFTYSIFNLCSVRRFFILHFFLSRK